MITALGFDLGRKTGWARVRDGLLLDCGFIDMGPSTDGWKFMCPRRARLVGDQLSYALTKMNAFVLAYERIDFGSNGARLIYGGESILLWEAAKRGFDIVAINPSTVKKIATGSGRAKKEDMAKAVPAQAMSMIKARIPKTYHEDVVDAYHVACVAAQLHKGDESGQEKEGTEVA